MYITPIINIVISGKMFLLRDDCFLIVKSKLKKIKFSQALKERKIKRSSTCNPEEINLINIKIEEITVEGIETVQY